jgi:hypothetical protein
METPSRWLRILDYVTITVFMTAIAWCFFTRNRSGYGCSDSGILFPCGFGVGGMLGFLVAAVTGVVYLKRTTLVGYH